MLEACHEASRCKARVLAIEEYACAHALDSLKGCEGTLEMEAVTDNWAEQQQCAFAADCPVCHTARPPPLPVRVWPCQRPLTLARNRKLRETGSGDSESPSTWGVVWARGGWLRGRVQRCRTRGVCEEESRSGACAFVQGLCAFVQGLCAFVEGLLRAWQAVVGQRLA